MNKSIPLLFPGQGSQCVGMTATLREAYPQAREFLDQADAVLGFSLSRLCLEGPKEELLQTRNTQPAIFVHSVLLTRLLAESGWRPRAVAGHSLGEYSALVAAGYLDFEDGLRLVRLRGELMSAAGERYPGTMAAVIGLTEDVLEQVVAEVAAAGVVRAANFNSPGQIVISGAVPAVEAAMKLCKERGARLVRKLQVSGAFHSPLMEPALEELSRALDKVEINPGTIPVYPNVTARSTTDPEEIREMLKRQLVSPVLWRQTVEQMAADGYRRFLEVGPGKVLQGLVKKTDADLEVSGVDTAEDLRSWISGEE